MLEYREYEPKQLRAEVDFLQEIDPHDRERLLLAISWQEPQLLSGFIGRKGFLPLVTAIEFEGIVYDMFSLSGIGYRPFELVSENAGRNSGNIVYPVSPKNFVSAKPSLFTTLDVIGSKIIERRAIYCPTGGYTKREAKKKLANSQTMQRINGREFAIPIPIAIGYYPNIVLIDGSHPHFLIFMEPNQGKRLDSELVRRDFYAKRSFEDITSDFIKGGRILAAGIRNLHDLGYVHREPYPGNLGITRIKRQPYIADFETMRKLTAGNESLARALDLRILMTRYIEMYTYIILNIKCVAIREFSEFFELMVDEVLENHRKIALPMIRVYLHEPELELENSVLVDIMYEKSREHRSVYVLEEVLKKHL